MKQSPFTSVCLAAQEMEAKATMVPGEYGSIMSTISNSIQCLGSPALQMSLSGKSTISIADFLKPGKVRKLFIMVPAYMLEAMSGVIRCLFTAFALQQQRAPLGRVHFVLDEAGQLGNFDYLPQMYSFLRGSRGKVTTYWQNIGQILANFGEHHADTIISNAQSKLILGVGSEKSAKFVSDNILGKTTYQYLSEKKYVEAAHQRAQALKNALNGDDLLNALLEYERHHEAMHTPEMVARPLMMTDELIGMPGNIGILSIQGMDLKPYCYRKIPYFLNPAVAHRFLPNPFHPPFDRIFIPSALGQQKAVPIVSEKVPEAIAHLPQCSGGMWSYPKGFCPLKSSFLTRFKRSPP